MNNSVLMYNKSQFMHLDELCACVFQVDALRLRLEEKDATLNKKSKQIQESVRGEGHPERRNSRPQRHAWCQGT